MSCSKFSLKSFILLIKILLCSIAVNFPNGGEINLINTPESKYQKIINAGPSQPTVSASFLENKIISKTGLEKFEYRLLKDDAHLSISWVKI
jgi:hypothetical protein